MCSPSARSRPRRGPGQGGSGHGRGTSRGAPAPGPGTDLPRIPRHPAEHVTHTPTSADQGVITAGSTGPQDHLTVTGGVGASMFDERFGLAPRKPAETGPDAGLPGARQQPGRVHQDRNSPDGRLPCRMTATSTLSRRRPCRQKRRRRRPRRRCSSRGPQIWSPGSTATTEPGPRCGSRSRRRRRASHR
ncbi:Dyp-type peroxidase domain-containing protein [Streptomyces sp. 24-1644]|uniref:Dyp-type peroxidase domain-containing protein n=1 Tax=Streptomyces sp. 24-1644 TaxID=3457315 RepID=UPI003FA75D0E